jgi:predicted ATPase
MLLRRLQIVNFRSISELEIDFGRFTALIGANNSGNLQYYAPSRFSLKQHQRSLRTISSTKIKNWKFNLLRLLAN